MEIKIVKAPSTLRNFCDGIILDPFREILGAKDAPRASPMMQPRHDWPRTSLTVSAPTFLFRTLPPALHLHVIKQKSWTFGPSPVSDRLFTRIQDLRPASGHILGRPPSNLVNFVHVVHLLRIPHPRIGTSARHEFSTLKSGRTDGRRA
ncbi:hypothetical protein AK830_g6475 [Neonectria ditissima]|uniref:Uncharacterized protein n=1 Tax=Neonectria ditissima TaxID=78410 RepID=A0A0P7BIW2_9HYPO|nr:hypothetical protein AK830_g6475 [Neonectria ditissima]